MDMMQKQLLEPSYPLGSNDNLEAILKAIKNEYTLIEDSFNNQQQIIRFIWCHDLTDFLLSICEPINAIFLNLNFKKTLHLFKCWDEIDYHLVLTIHSNEEDMDRVTQLEEQLFERIIEHYPEHRIEDVFNYLSIAQRSI